MIINKRGYFEDSNPGHPIDENLGKYLCQYFGSKYAGHTVLDLGCGDGYYTKLLRENPYSVGNKIQCDGYDGNPNTPQLTNGICGILDLTVSFKLVKKYHTVLCLEVGEHIPKTYFLNFIENIHNNNTEEVILSWAIPGQGGHGHVNELPNETVIETFKELGYSHDKDLDQKFRDASSLFWFKNTIMIFTRK